LWLANDGRSKHCASKRTNLSAPALTDLPQACVLNQNTYQGAGKSKRTYNQLKPIKTSNTNYTETSSASVRLKTIKYNIKG